MSWMHRLSLAAPSRRVAWHHAVWAVQCHCQLGQAAAQHEEEEEAAVETMPPASVTTLVALEGARWALQR